MQLFDNLLDSIAVLVIIAVLGLAARQAGLLKKEWSGSLSRIIFDFGIPAMIFVNLASVGIDLSSFEAPAILVAIQLCMLGLAWIIGRKAGLQRPQLGVVVLCSAFGTSATLGYSIISFVFPGNPGAMVEAALISELGVGLMIFTLGPILAMRFGSENEAGESLLRALSAFCRTPIFVSLLVGMAWNGLGLPGEEHAAMKPIFQAGKVLAGLVVPLSVLVISINLYVPNLRQYLKPFSIVVALKLLSGPLLAGVLAAFFGVPELWQDELIIMAGLPPAVLNVVYLQRHGGDAELASAITAGASLVSVGTILLVVGLMG